MTHDGYLATIGTSREPVLPHPNLQEKKIITCPALLDDGPPPATART